MRALWKAIVIVLCCYGCTPEPKTAVRLGTNVWPGYEPLYLARDLNYISDAELHLIEFSSASQVIKAFTNGALNAAALTMDEALLLAGRGQPVSIIAALDVSHGADVILAKPEFNQMAALRGRRVGVENTALGAYVLNRALQLANMKVSDVTIVPLEVNEDENAYKNNLIDAVVTFEPFSGRLLELGATKLFDSTQIPGEIIDVLVVRNDFLESHSAELTALLRAWFNALKYQKQDPDAAADRMARREAVTVSEFKKSLQGLVLADESENRRLFLGQPVLLEASLQKLQQVMHENNLMNTSANVDLLVDSKLIDALLKNKKLTSKKAN